MVAYGDAIQIMLYFSRQNIINRGNNYKENVKRLVLIMAEFGELMRIIMLFIEIKKNRTGE